MGERWGNGAGGRERGIGMEGALNEVVVAEEKELLYDEELSNGEIFHGRAPVRERDE